MLGVVEVQHLDPVDAKALQAFLQRAAGARRGEVAGLHVAVELGRDGETCGQAAPFADHRADAPLALAEAVIVGRVEAVDRPVEDGADGGECALLVDRIAVGVGHAAQSGSAEHDRRDFDAGISDPVLFHVVLPQIEPASTIASGVAQSDFCRSVMIQPGTTVLTRMRSRPSSRAMVRVSPWTAALAVA